MSQSVQWFLGRLESNCGIQKTIRNVFHEKKFEREKLIYLLYILYAYI